MCYSAKLRFVSSSNEIWKPTTGCGIYPEKIIKKTTYVLTLPTMSTNSNSEFF